MLEQNQQLHNRVITAIGNNSESNDHTQHKNSMNNALISSAEAFAAGKTLGMSEEQVLQHLSQKRRRQASPGQKQTENDLRRQLVQSAASLVDAPLPGAEIQGVGYREAPEVDPFGQMQDEFQQFGGSAGPAAAREEMVGLGMISPNEMTEDERIRMSEAVDRPDVAPKSVLQDALTNLKQSEAEQSGFNRRIAALFGGIPARPEGAAQVEGNLEFALDPRAERAAQQDAARRMSEADMDRASYRRAAYNNIKAQIEAAQLNETMYRPSSIYPGIQLPAVLGDQNLAGITRGGAGASFDFPIAMQTPGGPAIDPTGGQPLGAYGPVYVSPNTDQSADLNAPQTTRAWMVERQPEYSDGGRSFGNYPQVDVTGTTTLFANRLRGEPGFGNISANVRGVDEVDRAVQMAAAAGDMKFATREPVVGPDGRVTLQSTPQTTPDVRGLLSALRYTPAQEQELANALYQMEVAKATEINQQGKQQFFTRTGPNGRLERTGMQTVVTPGGASVFFDSPEAIDPRDGQAQIARMRPGQTIEGKDIKTALAGLESPDAAKPFIGAVAVTDPQTGKTGLEQDAGPEFYTAYNKTGESDPVAIERKLREQEQGFAYNRAKKAARKDPRAIVRPASQQPVNEEALRGKVAKASLVSERAKRDDERRAAQESSIMEYMPPSMRRGTRAPLRRPSL